MLWVPNPTRASFWARKLTSLLAFEQLKVPMASPPCVRLGAAEPFGGAVERFVPRGGTQLAAVADQGLGETGVLHDHTGSPNSDRTGPVPVSIAGSADNIKFVASMNR